MVLRLENLVARWLEVPGFYAHPTFVGSDPVSGIAPLAQAGVWSMTSSMVEGHAPPATFDAPQPVYAWAELRSLSLFGVFTGNLAASPSALTGGTTTLGGGIADTTVTSLPVVGGGATPLSGGGNVGNPSLTDPAGVVTATTGGGGTLPLVYVDFEYVGVENGTQLEPFNTLEEGVEAATVGGTVRIVPGESNETLAGITKPVQLEVDANPARQVSGVGVSIGSIFACGPNRDDFEFTSFSATTQVRLARDAIVQTPDIQLVATGFGKTGAVWTPNKIVVERGFVVEFDFTLDGLNPSFFQLPTSDGISFVIQNTSSSPPLTTGGEMGYTGIPNSVAVEFDTFRNVELNDPFIREVSVHTNGAGANSSHNDFSIASAPASPLTTRTTARIEYDFRGKRLLVSLNGSSVLTINNFDLAQTINLDNGSAYLGIMATTGIPEVTNGPSRLHSWKGAFPQMCEEVFHERPVFWNSELGYDSDLFDHRITGDFLQPGDTIMEQLTYLNDNMDLKPATILDITGAAKGRWTVESDTRHGIAGLWRGSIDPNNPDGHLDQHGFAANSPDVVAFFQGGGTVGTAEFMQTMVDEATNLVVAKHRLTFRFVKIAPGFTQGNRSCYLTTNIYHQIVRKQGACHPMVWPGAALNPPQIPCKP